MTLVSVVIPALNEARYIGPCVRSVLAQEVDATLEVLVVDDDSSDGTGDLARAEGATIVPNAGRGIPSALNSGLAAMSGDVLLRFDAHAEMPPGYVAACVRALAEEHGAVNVGGWRVARGESPWANATGTALASRLGVGNARIWRKPPAGEGRRDVDTVPLGCFPAAALREVGGWDESLLANEDFELNHRLRRAGGRVVFDPEIWSVYHPRETLGALARQYWRYGNWKAEVLARSPESLRPRQLAPAGVLGAAVLAVAPGTAGAAGRAGLAAYAAVLGAASARERTWHLAPVLATMHVAWGAGLARGLVSGAAKRARGARQDA